jgi:hypothetical protein
MNIHSPSEHVRSVPGFLLAITAAATNGASVDTQGYTRAKVIFNSVPTGVGTTSTLSVQTAPDNGAGAPGAWTTVGTNLVAATAGVTGVQVEDINLMGATIAGNRWIRLVHTGAGGAAAGIADGLIELYNPFAYPAQQINTVGAAI